MKLHRPASALMCDREAHGLALFDIRLTFQKWNGLGLLLLPGADIHLLYEVSQVLTVSTIEEQFVFVTFFIAAHSYHFQRRLSEPSRAAFALQFLEVFE